MGKETLRFPAPPEKLTRKGISESESLSLDELEQEKVKKIIEVLTHPEFDKLIEEGKVTVGLIKPRAYDGRDLPSTDVEATKFLLAEIGEKAIFNITVKLSREEAEVFYKPNREEYSKSPSEADSNISIWESTIDFTVSGPITFILIYDEQGQAIEWWREKMGHTYADMANPASIRGKHAIRGNLPNNLVHGSDSKESVRREIGVLVNHLRGITTFHLT